MRFCLAFQRGCVLGLRVRIRHVLKDLGDFSL